MMHKRQPVTLILLLAALLLISACAPAAGDEPAVTVAPAAGSEAVQPALKPATAPASSAETIMNETTDPGNANPTAVPAGSAGSVVETTPLSEAELAAQPPGQSEAGAGSVVETTPLSEAELAAQPPGQSDAGAGEGQPAPDDPGATTPESWGPPTVFSNDTYQFSLTYPADFVQASQPFMRVLELGQAPAASFPFMNPHTAAADAPEYELADFEVRVYPAQAGTPLEAWLQASTLLQSARTPTPFQTEYASGLEVCLATMQFPDCTYFVAGEGWFYQLIPVTLEGQAMLESFRLTP